MSLSETQASGAAPIWDIYVLNRRKREIGLLERFWEVTHSTCTYISLATEHFTDPGCYQWEGNKNFPGEGAVSRKVFSKEGQHSHVLNIFIELEI